MIAKHLNDGENRGNDPEKDARKEPSGVQPSIANAEGSRCEKQRPKDYAENGRSSITPHWKPTESKLVAPDLPGGSATKCSLDPDHTVHREYTAFGVMATLTSSGSRSAAEPDPLNTQCDV